MASAKLPTYRLAFQKPYIFSDETNFADLYTGVRSRYMQINFRDFRKDQLMYYVQQDGTPTQ